jgi:hypothetical protein
MKEDTISVKGPAIGKAIKQPIKLVQAQFPSSDGPQRKGGAAKSWLDITEIVATLENVGRSSKCL